MITARHYTSKKRQAIYDALSATKAHPSAEMLYTALKPEYPKLSIGTVYRCLAGFCEEGSAVVVANVDGRDRYDACTAMHPHFICRSCHSVIDLPVPDVMDLSGHTGLIAQVEQADGCRIDSWSLTFSGICPACQAAAHK